MNKTFRLNGGSKTRFGKLIAAVAFMTLSFPTTAYAEEDNASQEEDSQTQVEFQYSGTLPVLFVTTQDEQPIVSKEDYIPATYYLDPMGTDFAPLGSVDEQLPTEIRGRGNSSWTLPKKPYKLKLGKKQSMLGMAKNKHWALLAHYFYSDWTSHYLGFELGRVFDLGWVPEMKPVELVINGKYEGLYFLTETVRIDSGRLEIFEQKDEETDPAIIPGGWLVEIDNYPDPCQLILQETDQRIFRLTYHTPEILSDAQREWLTNEFNTINALIYTEDKTSNEWEKYIDAESLAKYFVIQDIMDNTDGFLGSFYLHKDEGEDSKWVVGPLWDVGSRCRTKTNFTPYMEGWGAAFTPQNIPHWILELLKFPHFVQMVHRVYETYCDGDFSYLADRLTAYGSPLVAAEAANYARWPEGGNANTMNKITYMNRYLLANSEWFHNRISMKAESLAISQKSLKLSLGESFDLAATFTPDNTVDPLAWGSSDKSVATVDQQGHVTAVGPGFATIYALCGAHRQECLVQSGEQCEAPIITVDGNRLTVYSPDEDAVLHTDIVAEDHGAYEHENGAEIHMTGVYHITSFATARNKIKSGVSQATLAWVKDNALSYEPLTLNKEKAILLTCEANGIHIKGTVEGVCVQLYSIEGMLLSEIYSSNEETIMPFVPERGRIYVLRYGDDSIKLMF